ncbi:Tolloid-like protein 1, partial [Stegodyphus mimosarum]
MRDRRTAQGAPLLLLLTTTLTTAVSGAFEPERGSWTRFPRLVSSDLDMEPGKAELFEGDIIVDRIPHPDSVASRHLHNPSNRHRRKGVRGRHFRRRHGRAATARTDRLWPHAVIPYEIEANFSGEHRALFKQAMRYWENETCVQFVERSPSQHPDYIVFTERACGCCSFVGRRGNGAQAISIGKNCDKFGIVVHELGHVVGFWHEHTRPDRDKHVQIISRNIVAGQEYNFNKLTDEEVNSLGLNYDYESIMHYARNTFSRSLALDTILPVRGKVVEIGQRLRLSSGDIAQTNKLYKCPECGRTCHEPSSQIQSPGFQYGKLGPHRCVWRISATQGERIVFEFTAMDIDPSCNEGYLEIRDGYWSRSPLLGRFCGNRTLGERFVSTGHRMLVIYHTTNAGSIYKGFQAKYEALCGGLLEQSEGTLQSPNYPDEYLADKECVWKIAVSPGSQVALTFQAFEVEYHDNCAYDFVEIRDGLELHSPLLARLCGYKIPEEVRSISNKMLIRFFSDSSIRKMGFSATFVTEIDECSGFKHGCQQKCINTVGSYRCECDIGYELHSDGKRCEDACGGILKGEKGTITSPSFPDLYPSNKQCIWEIMAPPQFRITLNFTHFDLEGTNQECEYDSVDIRSRTTAEEEWKKQGTYCGSRLPAIVTSEGNVLRIEFTS